MDGELDGIVEGGRVGCDDGMLVGCIEGREDG